MNLTAVARPVSEEAIQEEKALVERMLAGDEAAMEEFADGYFPVLYRFARARLGGDVELTREIVQTTAVKALEKLGSYRGEAPLATWLFACCRNEIAMHFRRKKRGPMEVEVDEQNVDPGFVPSPRPLAAPDKLVREEEASLVHTALDLLPAHYARALEWKYLERLPVVEIAERLRLGPKAAESVLSRARRAFREGYERLVRAQSPSRGLGGLATLEERRAES